MVLCGILPAFHKKRAKQDLPGGNAELHQLLPVVLGFWLVRDLLREQPHLVVVEPVDGDPPLGGVLPHAHVRHPPRLLHLLVVVEIAPGCLALLKPHLGEGGGPEVQEQEVKGIYFIGEQGRFVAEELEANGIYFTGEQGLAGGGRRGRS